MWLSLLAGNAVEVRLSLQRLLVFKNIAWYIPVTKDSLLC